MLVLLPFFLIPPLFGERGLRVTYFFLRLWSWIFSKLNFIPYEISGRENIETGRSYIFVSNHTSFLDLPGICLALPGEFRPLAKKELLKIPVFGWIAATATVIVDRTSHESRRTSLDRLANTLKRGVSVLIFAEGTQNRTSQPLQPFKDGAFRMAMDTGCALVPIVVEGAGRLMPPGKFSILPGKVRIHVGKPMEVAENAANGLQDFKSRTYDTMLAMLMDLKTVTA